MSTTGKFGLDAELEAKAIAKYSKEEEKNASEWIASVTGEPMGDFLESLKSGVILCKLANAIMPGSVGQFNPRPKHYLEAKGNIGLYITACSKIGLPSQDMITPLDLSDSKADPGQVLNHIFALARQAQAVGFHGPSLGVRYYKSREEQIALEVKKAKEREEEAKRMAEYEKMLLEKRDLAIEKKQAKNTAANAHLQTRKKNRVSQREQRGRNKLVSAPGVAQVADRSPSPVKYGMDAEHEERVGNKYNYDLEDALLDWIEDVTGYAMDAFVENLKSGVVLCELLNKIAPGTVRNIHVKKGQRSAALNELENLKKFCDGCVGIGVAPGDLFQPHDLYEQKNLVQVQNGLWALAKFCSESPTYKQVPKIQYGLSRVSRRQSRRRSTQHDDLSETQLDPDSWLPSWKATSPPKPGFFLDFRWVTIDHVLILVVFVIVFFAFLSMISGFGSAPGATSLATFVQLCHNTSNTTGCYNEVDFFYFTFGSGLFGLALAGLLLEFLGPKITCSSGIIIRIIGCVLLGFIPPAEESALPPISMALLAGGGPIVLVSLMPLAHVWPNRLATSQFGLASFFVFGSCIISLAFSYIPADPIRNYIMWAFAGVHFFGLVVSILTVPLSRWISVYHTIPSQEEGENDDSPKSWCCTATHVHICLVSTFLFLQNTWQLQQYGSAHLTDNLSIIVPIVGGCTSLLCILFGVIADHTRWGTLVALLTAIITSAVGALPLFIPDSTYTPLFWISTILSTTLTFASWITYLSTEICRIRIGLSVFASGILAGLLFLPGVLLLAMYIAKADSFEYIQYGLFVAVGILIVYPIVQLFSLFFSQKESYKTL